MVKFYKVSQEKLSAVEPEHANIIIYIKPTGDEVKEIIEAYKVDEYYINSALDPDELARTEFEDQYKVVIIKRPKNYCTDDNLIFKISSIGLFLFKTKMLIIMPEDIEIVNFKQTKKLKTIMDVFIKILIGTISHFLGHLKTINMISDSIEQKIDASVDNIYLRHMFSIQKSLVYYLNAINYNAVLFEKIKNISKKLGFTEDHLDYLDEIIVENTQCYKQAEIYTNIISGIMNTHASIISNNLNKTIHRLTLITTVFMPLTLIASIGGMSEWTMMTKNLDWRLSYSLFMVGMVVIGFLTFMIIRKISKMTGDKSAIIPKKAKSNANFLFWRAASKLQGK